MYLTTENKLQIVNQKMANCKWLIYTYLFWWYFLYTSLTHMVLSSFLKIPSYVLALHHIYFPESGGMLAVSLVSLWPQRTGLPCRQQPLIILCMLQDGIFTSISCRMAFICLFESRVNHFLKNSDISFKILKLNIKAIVILSLFICLNRKSIFILSLNFFSLIHNMINCICQANCNVGFQVRNWRYVLNVVFYVNLNKYYFCLYHIIFLKWTV